MNSGEVCPSCGAHVPFQAVYFAGLPTRIRCDSCSARLRYAGTGGLQVVELLAIACVAGVGLSLGVVASNSLLPVATIALAVCILGWAVVEGVMTLHLRRKSTLEFVRGRDSEPRTLTRRAFTIDRSVSLAVIALGLMCLVFSLMWIGVRLSGWQGVYDVQRYRAGQTVVISESGAKIAVPEGWSGNGISQLRVPRWLGLWRTPSSRSVVELANPGSDNGRVVAYYGSERADWSDLTPSRASTTIKPDDSLSASGVHRIIVKDALGGSGAPTAAWLFVDDPGGRYILEIHLNVEPGDAGAPDVVAALHDAGVSLSAK